MSWCDKLASVPTLGVRLSPALIPGDFILKSVAPAIMNFVDDDPSRITMEEHGSFAVKFGTQDGFKYGIDTIKAHVGFQHQLKAVPVSGGAPVMKMLSTPRPFTELLPEVSARLQAAVLALPEARQRRVERIGIVSFTNIDEDDLPPGIARYLAYQRTPWNEPLDHFNIQIAVALKSTEKWTEKCIHTLVKPDDPEALMSLQFDWQRVYKSPKTLEDKSLSSDIGHCIDTALSYFEDIAEGQRFDV